MAGILEFISLNYTWFLCGAILILLAIIGGYAEKTNFGQPKQIKKENEEQDVSKNIVPNFNNNQRIQQPVVQKKEENISIQQNQIPSTPENFNNGFVSFHHNMETTKKNFDVQYEKLDKEIDTLLPEKDVIDDELLNDIENLSLDKTQKIKINEIPDLDDLELPEIKRLKKADEDIWKI